MEEQAMTRANALASEMTIREMLMAKLAGSHLSGSHTGGVLSSYTIQSIAESADAIIKEYDKVKKIK